MNSQLAQETLEKVFKPWCHQKATQLFRFAHKRFSGCDGRGGVVFWFERTCDIAAGNWPTEEAGWKYLSQQSIGSLGIKTNHVLSAVQRYSPQQQCVVIVLVREAKFDRFYFLNAPKVHALGAAQGPDRAALVSVSSAVGSASELMRGCSVAHGARAAWNTEWDGSHWGLAREDA